jgi:uncharacterized protein (TIGR03067 family)
MHRWVGGVVIAGLAVVTLPLSLQGRGARSLKLQDKVLAKGLKELQGSWEMVSKERNGEKQEVKKSIVTFRKDRFETVADGKPMESGTISVNPDKKPKTYDVTITGDFKEKGQTYHGIYEIDGDTLRTCVNTNAGKERPKEFASKPGRGHLLIVWKRVKPGEVSTDAIKSREVISGNVRVVLLRVGQAIDFTEDAKKPAEKSLDVLVMVELLEGVRAEPVVKGLEVFAAGSTESAVRFDTSKDAGFEVITKFGAAVETYEEYEKQKIRKLPAVKGKDRAFVISVLIPISELTAKRLDLKLSVDLPKNKEHVVWFKGISF